MCRLIVFRNSYNNKTDILVFGTYVNSTVRTPHYKNMGSFAKPTLNKLILE